MLNPTWIHCVPMIHLEKGLVMSAAVLSIGNAVGFGMASASSSPLDHGGAVDPPNQEQGQGLDPALIPLGTGDKLG